MNLSLTHGENEFDEFELWMQSVGRAKHGRIWLGSLGRFLLDTSGSSLPPLPDGDSVKEAVKEAALRAMARAFQEFRPGAVPKEVVTFLKMFPGSPVTPDSGAAASPGDYNSEAASFSATAGDYQVEQPPPVPMEGLAD